MTCADDQRIRLSELMRSYAHEVRDCGDAREVEETAWQLMMYDAISVAQERAWPGRGGCPYQGVGIISCALDAVLNEMHAEAAA